MSPLHKYAPFRAFGIEIEYMIVDSATLLPKPIAHELLRNLSHRVVNSLRMGDTVVSNELAAHVIELKTAAPSSDFDAIARSFQSTVQILNDKLASFGAMLAPGGMHPFMHPETHSGIWQFDDREIYEWYDATFGCRSHGWLNLQSCHLNLPFQTEAEFALLHDAVIIALPLLPALSGASPSVEGRYEGHLDTRLHVYADNQKRFPAIAGHVIPESIHDEATYRRTVLAPAYESVRSLDPEKLIEADWLNSRGAIARFDRGSIEIRILDAQENPRCDLAICSLLVQLLKSLAALGPEAVTPLARQFSPAERKQQLMNAASQGQNVSLAQKELAAGLGLGEIETLHDFWSAFLQMETAAKRSPFEPFRIERILTEGSLGERMLRQGGESPSPRDLAAVLRGLCHDLANGSKNLVG